MNKNRAISIIIIVIAVVLLALAILYFFFRKGSVPPVEPQVPGSAVFPISPNAPGTSNTPSSSGNQNQPGYENQPQTFKQSLRLLSSLPVSGATIFEKNAETFVRYVERATGHIYEVQLSRTEPPYRISNTTIPKIYEAVWVQNGDGVIARFLKDGSDEIQTFYAGLKPSATSTEQKLVDGTFLASGINALAVSPTQDRIFYLVKAGQETFGTRASPNGTLKAQLWSSSAHEWLVSWKESRTITLTTKPSADVPGYLYFLDATSGAFRKILSGINGLTTLHNSALSFILYSETIPSSFTLKLLDTQKQKVSEIGVATLPEKCAWGPVDKTALFCGVPDNISSGQYPDAWYQGQTSFTDSVWKINIKTGETRMILSPQTVAQQTMDIINPMLNSKEEYLLFMNKKDLSLWVLDLMGPSF